MKRPPFCIKIFDNQAAAKVIYYITNTYLKHYKLYKYAFTPIVIIEKINSNYNQFNLSFADLGWYKHEI